MTFSKYIRGIIPLSELISYFISSLLVLCSCSRNDLGSDGKTLARLQTIPVINIASSTAESGGIISTDGGSTIKRKGVCWSDSLPSADSIQKTTDGSGPGNFTSKITGLKPNKRYLVQAYAENESGLAYGNQVSFVTSGIDSLVCKRIIHEGLLIRGLPAQGVVSKILYFGKTPGAYEEKVFQAINIGGMAARLEAGNFAADSGFLTLQISGTPSRAGLVAFSITAGGKTCPLYRYTGIEDPEGNRYPTIGIGSQTWMQSNLRVTRYRNGDPIPLVSNISEWSNSSSGAYGQQPAGMNEDSLYGKLYNWYAINDPRGLCPSGFHVPGDSDWQTLENLLGGSPVAGGKLKSAGTLEAGDGYWKNPNAGASNSSGFSALPGGYRDEYGEYKSLSTYGYWWTADAPDDQNGWFRFMVYLNQQSNRTFGSRKNGMAVRCILD